MTVIDLTPICKRLGEGLAKVPESSDWDPDLMLWSYSWTARFGAIDGWLWATDMSTALIERSVDIDDLECDVKTGRKVIEFCQTELPPPFHKVMLRHLAQAGGNARVPGLGDFDLDRLWQAALWVGGPHDDDTADNRDVDSVVMGIEHIMRDDLPFQMAHLCGGSNRGRRAVVMGMQFKGDWFPTIDLPLEPLDAVVSEPVGTNQETRT